MKIQSGIGYPSIVKLVTRGGFQAGFIVVTLLLVVYYNVAYYWYAPLTGAQVDYIDNARSALQITQVLPGSPGQTSGLREGDRLLTIDGRAVATFNRPFYTHKGTGESVQYVVERAGQRLTFNVLAEDYFGRPEHLLAMLPLGLLSLLVYALGLLLCLRSAPQDTRARLVGAVWLLAGLALAAGPGYANGGWFVVDVLLAAFAAGGYVSLAAHLYFPAASFSNRARILILRAHLGLMLLALTAYAWQRLLTDGTLPPEALVSGTIIRYVFILTWLANLGLLLKNSFAAQDPETKRQAGIILFGTLLGVLPVLLLTALPKLLLSPHFAIPPGQITIIMLVCIPISYGYVIGQHRLLKIDLLFNRALAWFILAALTLLTSGGVVGLLALWHGSPQTQLLGGVLAAVLVTGLRNRIQVWVDHMLYGASYDFRSVTTHLSRRLSQTTERRDLGEALVEFVQQMHIQKSELLLAWDGSLELPQGGASRVADDEICQFLLETGLPARALSVWAVAGPETSERWADLAWGRVFAPIAYNGALHGVWVLGERLIGDYYSEQDMENIHTVGQQVALALANLATVETLRGLGQRLVQTDEEQRRGVARELHDDVLKRVSDIRNHEAALQSDDLGAQVEELATRVRQIIKAQRPAFLGSGIALALEGLIENLPKQPAGAQTDIWLNNLLPEEESIILSDEQTTALYRIVQETLSNVLKHAQAGEAVVTLKTDGDILEVEIKDNGVGMEDSDHEPPGHYGLIGMRERAAMIGATLIVTSVVGKETTVRVRLKR